MRNHLSQLPGIVTILVFMFTATTFAQNSSEYLWTDIEEGAIVASGDRVIIPTTYRTLKLDFSNMKTFLQSAPDEDLVSVNQSSFIINLPLPNGEFKAFRMVYSPVMADELAAKYPNIKTYLGQGIDDRTASVRFDITQHGFHAMILSVQGSVFIDPYSKGDTEYYISYYKKNLKPNENHLDFSCNLLGLDSPSAQQLRELVENGTDIPSGDELRTYRLACATTGEWRNSSRWFGCSCCGN